MLLFLDLDGVLTTERSRTKDHKTKFDSRCVTAMQDLMKRLPDLRIVVSSDWRWRLGMDKVEAHLRYEDLDTVADAIVSATPQTFGNSHDNEIQQWLDEHWDGTEPYVIVDDLPLWHHGVNVLQTNDDTGLTPRHVDAICHVMLGT